MVRLETNFADLLKHEMVVKELANEKFDLGITEMFDFTGFGEKKQFLNL